MSDNLQQQITEAEAAASELDRQAEIQRKAGQLPALRQQQLRQQQQAQAAAQLEGAIPVTQQRLDEINQKCADFQSRFAAWRAELSNLQIEYDFLVKAAAAARAELRPAVAAYEATHTSQADIGVGFVRMAPTTGKVARAAELDTQLRRVADRCFGDTSPWPTSRGYSEEAALVARTLERRTTLRTR